MTVSSGIAVAGIAIAFFIWVMRKELAAGLARPSARSTGCSSTSTTSTSSTTPRWCTLWARCRATGCAGRGCRRDRRRRTDVGTVVDAGAATLRRLQTGSIRTYASSLFVGVVVILGYACGDGVACPADLSWGLHSLARCCCSSIGNADVPRQPVPLAGAGISVAEFALTLAIWMAFDPGSAEFQFVERVPWIPAFGIDYVGIDGISLLLVVLTGFLTPITSCRRGRGVDKKVKGSRSSSSRSRRR